MEVRQMSARRNSLLGFVFLVLAVPAAAGLARADSTLFLHEGDNVCSIESRKRVRTKYKVVGTFPTLKEACLYAQDFFDGSQDNKTVCWEYTDSTRDACYTVHVLLPESARRHRHGRTKHHRKP
jgi:hypothetical protein